MVFWLGESLILLHSHNHNKRLIVLGDSDRREARCVDKFTEVIFGLCRRKILHDLPMFYRKNVGQLGQKRNASIGRLEGVGAPRDSVPTSQLVVASEMGDAPAVTELP